MMQTSNLKESSLVASKPFLKIYQMNIWALSPRGREKRRDTGWNLKKTASVELKTITVRTLTAVKIKSITYFSNYKHKCNDYVTESWSDCRILKNMSRDTNDTFSLFKTVTSWDYWWIATIRDKNALQLEKNEGMAMDLLQMAKCALSGKNYLTAC